MGKGDVRVSSCSKHCAGVALLYALALTSVSCVSKKQRIATRAGTHSPADANAAQSSHIPAEPRESDIDAGLAPTNFVDAGSTAPLPHTDLPRFTLEAAGEWSTDQPLSPEGVLVAATRVSLATASGLFRFSRDGSVLGVSESKVFYDLDGIPNTVEVGVYGRFVHWESLEPSDDILAETRQLSGVALARASAETTTGKYYLADKHAPSVILLEGASVQLAELSLPGVVPEALGHSVTTGLLVADGRGRRLLRVSDDVSQVLATANLPPPYEALAPTGLSFFDGLLYVCFRGESRIASFAVGDVR